MRNGMSDKFHNHTEGNLYYRPSTRAQAEGKSPGGTIECGGALLELTLLTSIIFGLLVTTLSIGLPSKIESIEEELQLDHGIMLSSLNTELNERHEHSDRNIISLNRAGNLLVFGMVEKPGAEHSSYVDGGGPPARNGYGSLDKLIALLASNKSIDEVYATVLDTSSRSGSTFALPAPSYRSHNQDWETAPTACDQMLKNQVDTDMALASGDSLHAPYALGLCIKTVQGKIVVESKRLGVSKWLRGAPPYERLDVANCFYGNPYGACNVYY